MTLAHEAEEALYNLLGAEMAEITRAVGNSKDYLIILPDVYTVDLTLEDIASLVARTSNAYGRIARLAGIARARQKIAKGRYERKFKRSRGVGTSDKQREANAMEASVDEHTEMIAAEALAEMIEGLENGARVASESARKIFDKAQAMQIAQAREGHGQFKESDYRPW